MVIFGKKQEQEEAQQQAIPAAVKAKAEIVKTLVGNFINDKIDYAETRKQRKEEFDKKIESLQISEEEKEAYRKEYARYESTYLRLLRQRLSLKDFEILTLLGRGAFGRVYLAKKIDTQEVLALKQLLKKSVNTSKKLTRLMVERDVLMNKKDSPWLVRLYYSFQDEKSLYLAMEYVPGGDMWALLSKVGSLKEEYARFYLAEMVSAVSALHKLGYIHRDLKPDNFLIDRSGHLKLTDFGLSKAGLKTNYKNSLRLGTAELPVPNTSLTFAERKRSYRAREKQAFSFVGTLSYMAIEILAQEGYNHTVDWWSLGCILFEMLAGMPPFYSDTDEQIVMNVWQFKKSLVPPLGEDGEPVISEVAWDLITKLVRTPKKRIGQQGAEEIQEHPFFKAVDWENLRTSDRISPPFVPNLSHDADTAYFGGDPGELPASVEALLHNTYDEPPAVDDKNFSAFSFRRMSPLEPGVNVRLSDFLGGSGGLDSSSSSSGDVNDDEIEVEVAAEQAPDGVEGATFIVKRVAKQPYHRRMAAQQALSERDVNSTNSVPSPSLPPPPVFVRPREYLSPDQVQHNWLYQLLMWNFPFGWSMPFWIWPTE